MPHKLQQQLVDFITATSDEIPGDISSLNSYERLRIYRNNYFGNLTNAIKITYPRFYNLVGEAFFNSCAKLYIKQNPPKALDLTEYALDFHKFIAQLDVPNYFSELARFESLMDICHHTGKPQEMRSIYNIHDVFEFCKIQDSDATLNLIEGEYLFRLC